MMPQHEVYAECKARSVAYANKFLAAFLPHRIESTSEYALPEFSDNPSKVFADADSLMRHLEAKRDEEYAVYWSRQGPGDPHQAMLFFTEDGGMIAGLASVDPDSERLLRQLAAVVGATFGLVVLEERPPGTLREFFELCREATSNRIVDGVFFPERSEPDDPNRRR